MSNLCFFLINISYKYDLTVIIIHIPYCVVLHFHHFNLKHSKNF